MLHMRLLILGWLEALRFTLHFNRRRGWVQLADAVHPMGFSRAARMRAPYPYFTSTTSPRVMAHVTRNAQLDTERMKASAFKLLKYAAICVAAVLIVVIVLFVVGLVLSYEPAKSFEARHLQNARAAVTDVDNDLVGAAPAVRTTAPDASTPMADDEARMAAIIVQDLPPVWWEVAVALEDRRFGKLGWIYGIDTLALPHLLAGRGASTLPMQLIGNLSRAKIDQRSHRGELFWKVRRKLKEIASTPTLVASTSGDDYLWLKRLIATHLPVMHGQIGGSTIGIAGAAWVMWGKTLSQLSAGEQAVLAGALKRNVYLRKEPDALVRKTWAYIKERAKLGLTMAYPDPDDRRRVDGLAQIDAMPDVPPLFLSDDLPLAARAHVVHRRNFTARAVVTEAQAELMDRYGRAHLAEMPVRGYQLTLSSMDNFQFKQKMDRVAAELTQRLGRECRLLVPLARDGFDEALYQRMTLKPDCAPKDLPKTERAQVIAVLANERGEILRFYQSGSEESIYAGVAGRSRNDGRYVPGEELRDVGSISKIAGAIFLAHEGDTPQQRYCREAYKDRLDSDGTTGFSDCRAPGASLGAREIFARSSNLGIFWRLRQFPEARLRAFAAELGLKLPPDVAAAYAIAFGQVRISPRYMHSLMDMTGKIVLGRTPRNNQLIHVVKRVNERGRYASFDSGEADMAPVIARYLSDANARLYVREVLGAVLTHSGGTLRFLADFTPQKNSAIAAHIGKTGTPANTGRFATDKIMTGSLVINGRYYSYFFAVRAPNPGKYPLGRQLGARHFAPMLGLLLNEIVVFESQREFDAHGQSRRLAGR